MRRIYLWTLDSPAIVVPASTGVIYCNQVDGVATEERTVEGFLIPLPKIESWVFDATWWYEHLNRREDSNRSRWEAIYVEIERALMSAPVEGLITEFRVIRDPQNVEAWMKIAFLRREPEQSEEHLSGFLTWQNCD